MIARLLFLAILLGVSARVSAQTVVPPFNATYSLVDLGTIAGLPTNFGGLTFKSGDPNTILIGGAANTASGRFYSVPVVRGAGNHITSFGAPVALGYGANNDAGVTYGPGGVLFYAKYDINQIGQVKPGSNADDAVTNLAGIGIANSPGPIVFVPPGFRAAGRFKVGSYRGGRLYDVPLTAAANGTYTLGTASQVATYTDQVEGLVYAPIGSPVFSDQALLVMEYGAGKVAAFDTDASNNPVPGTRREFITGLSGAVGATIDPVTGDFLFSTFGGGNKVIQIRGFTPPPPPATVTLVSSANPATYPASVTVTATVTGVAPVTGSVIFQNNGTTLATCNGVTLVSGSAACTLDLAAGSYTITAFYGGNSTNSSASGSVTQTVAAILPTANTGSATNISTTGANLSGTMQWGGAPATGAWDYGTTTAYGSTTAAGSANFPGDIGVGATLTGLSCGTTYHFRLRVTNSAGTTNGVDKTFTTAACPTLTAISPNQGPLAGGTVVTLTGTGFGAGMTVSVRGVANACRPVTVASATSATCSMPAGAAGPASVAVSLPGGSSNALTYTYDSVPTLTGGSPVRGPTAGGWPIALAGTGFVAGMTVNVAGAATPCQPVALQSQTSATCIMPPHAAGFAKVTVTTPGGTSASMNVLYVDTPEVTAISPARGPVAGGTTVVITGSSFSFVTGITVGGVPCASKSVSSTTEATCTTPPGTAGAANVVVTNPAGSSTPVAFTYDDVPAVTAVKPSQGPLAGGTLVTISGSSFVNGSTSASIGGQPCANVVHLSNAKLTCVAPAGAAGAQPVVVTTTGGASAPGSFTYDDVPLIASVAPGQGPVVGGTTITITGAAFIAGRTGVTVGGASCASVTVLDQATATCVTPSGTAGVAEVLLTTPGGTSGPGFFTFDDVPTVVAVSPDQGPTGGGTAITVTGTAFVSGSTTASVGGAACAGVTVTSTTSLDCTTPAGTAGVKDVTVTTPGGTSAPGFFTYDNLPVIKSLNPSQGPLAGGTTITITGTSFIAGSTTVLVGGAACPGVAVTGDKTLTCTTPAGTAGVKDVTVTTPGGTSSPGYFTYDDVPTLGAVAPAGGPLAGGTTITLTGTAFVAGLTTVSVGGAACTGVAVSGSSSLTCSTPARPAGSAVVSVTTPGGTSNTLAFVFHPVPTLATAAPAAGPTAGGTVVTLAGTGFVVGETTVTVGGAPCAAVHISSATQLECTTPARPSGAASVVATTPGGASNAISFTYDPVPVVTTVAPARGPLAGGTTITVTGSGFDPAGTTVSVGGQPCTSVSVASATSLTCATPAGSAGAASVVATTPGGTSAAAVYTYDPVPTVASVSPAGGPLAGGTTITVTGTGFLAGNTAVSVGGVACAGVAVASATSLTCATPAGTAGSASVVVTTPGGASNAASFTYDAVPVLVSVSPVAGTPAGGTTLTLGGSDFVAGSTTVTVGGLPCGSVAVVSPAVLTCVTPAGPAGPAGAIVTTPGGTSNAVTFTYALVPTLSAVSPSLGPVGGGTTITLAGTNFLAGSTTVTVGGQACGSIAVASATSLTCVTPPGVAGAALVVAATPAGASNTLTFTYGASLNGACGSASGVASAFMPAANLCSVGTPTTVTPGSPWTWACSGSGGGATAACSAPNQSTATGSGPARAVVSGGTWIVDAANSAGFIPVTGHPKSPPTLPPGVTFPHGLLDFQLVNGAAGSAATVTISYPAALPPGTAYWKYGPSPNGYDCTGAACATPHWYRMPATISGNTVIITIVDGGVGDDDLAANSVIVDQGGPGVPPGAGSIANVPTLSEWALALLAALLVLSAWPRAGRAVSLPFLSRGGRR